MKLPSCSIIFAVPALALTLTYDLVQAQVFTCGDYDTALGFGSLGFDLVQQVVAAPQCPMEDGIESEGDTAVKFMAPPTIHWHFYVIGGSDEPKYQVFPEGLLVPDVFDGALNFRYKSSVAFDDPGQAVVEVWLSTDILANIRVSGTGQVVEVTTPDWYFPFESSIAVTDSGTDNAVYVNLPRFALMYTASGTNSYLEANITSEPGFVPPASVITMSGSNSEAKVHSNDIASLTADISGSNQRFTKQGDFTRIAVSGTNNFVLINDGSCGAVQNSGTDNACSEITSTFTVAELECFGEGGTPTEVTCGTAAGTSAARSRSYQSTFVLSLVTLLLGGALKVLL